MTKDDAIKAIERDAIVVWLLREANLRGKKDTGDNRDTAFCKSHAEALMRRIAERIERGEHLPPEKA